MSFAVFVSYLFAVYLYFPSAGLEIMANHLPMISEKRPMIRAKFFLADHRDRQKYFCATLVFPHLSKNIKSFF